MTNEQEPLTIVQLVAENVKRLRAVDIEPTTNVVVIAGRNSQGKTSVLDSIAWALGGTRLADARPVSYGEDHAMVELDMGAFTVTRKWDAAGKSSLVVKSKEGAKYSSPQTFLDERLGALSFDPLAFSQKPDKEQIADLLALVDLPFDPDEMARVRQGIFDQRTDANRVLRDYEGTVQGQPRPGVIPEEVNITELLSIHRSAQEVVAQRQAALNDLANATTRVDELREQLAAAEVARQESEVAVSLLSPPPDMDDLDDRIEQAEVRNSEVREIRSRAEIYDRIDNMRAVTQAHTDELALIDSRKAKALEAAVMPVPGLSFDDDGVTYQGIPFRQCSASERLRISLGMAIAANPTIRVIRIVDGSLLDSENMAVIEQMAADSGSQVWIERVDESGSVGFVIEDGEVRQ